MIRRFAIVLVLGLGGCTFVTEADRQLEHQTLDAATLSLDLILATAGKGVSPEEVARIEAWLVDIKANSAQLVKSHGPAENPLAYSKEASQKARDDSGKSHEGFSWAAVGGVILSVGTVLFGLAKSPIAKMIPFIGPWIGAAEATIEGTERFMEKQKREGKPEVAAALAEELKRLQQDDRTKSLVNRLLGKAKDKLAKVLPKSTPTA